MPYHAHRNKRPANQRPKIEQRSPSMQLLEPANDIPSGGRQNTDDNFMDIMPLSNALTRQVTQPASRAGHTAMRCLASWQSSLPRDLHEPHSAGISFASSGKPKTSACKRIGSARGFKYWASCKGAQPAFTQRHFDHKPSISSNAKKNVKIFFYTICSKKWMN